MNDEYRLTIEDFRSKLTNEIRIGRIDTTETVNKLWAHSSGLTALLPTPFSSLKGAGIVRSISSASWRIGGSKGAGRRNEEYRLTNTSVRKNFFPLLDRRGCEGSSDGRGGRLKDITETANKLEANNIQFPISNIQYPIRNKKQEIKSKTEITNKLVARSSRLVAQNINSFSPQNGKRTVANKIKQSSAYET
ncbi:hypothetical protein [Maribellus sediminis]|uniref:hypothetical protein n=1 Tax=Maribellus sediminis TaxID=2696285 RepID=UPI0014321082|nr:hypothetical protein [Maribellus sediminis]